MLLGLAACGGPGYALPQRLAPSSTGAPVAPTGPDPATPSTPATPTTPNTPATPTTPTTPAANCSVFTWNSGAQSYFSQNCYACHSNVNASFDASKQASVAANIGAIYDSVATGRMPPGNRADAATVAQLRTWMDCMTP